MMVNSKTNLPESGLFLVQFKGPVDPKHRAELTAAGVELLKYVPEDAFVAKFDNVPQAKLQGLTYINWVGPYKPEHKVHPQLSALVKRTNAPVEVNILLPTTASASEIASVRAHLGQVHNETHLRQGIILRARLAPAQLDALSQLGAVLWVEGASKRKLVDEAASKIVGGDDGLMGTRTVTQQLGFDGKGVTICVADTGLDTGDTNTMHPDLRGRVAGFKFYGDLPDASDGYGHGSHCAGIAAGNAATGEKDDLGCLYGLGVAPGASIFAERFFDDNANEVDPLPTDETLTHDAVRAGAKIGSNSWGNEVNGEYDIDCAQFDELVRDADAGTPGSQPYILEFSAGNSGPQSGSINSPACAKNVIATGASENTPSTIPTELNYYAEGMDTMADFSSRGPCADGRIKPDVVAPGTWIASIASQAAPDVASVSWMGIDQWYVYMGGTSMAGPHAAGAAAVFVQFYQATHTNAMPSPALVKAALINSANELDESNGGPSPVPNNDEGWGRITLTNIINTNFDTAPRAFIYVDQTVRLTNTQVFTQHAFVRSAGQPLKVTLAYTDVPGFPGANPALVNDLDLEVVAPDGTLYRGNQFGTGESQPNSTQTDQLNNVEGVALLAPKAGDYQIRVRATRVVQDAVPETAAVDQDFALAISGDLARTGAGIVLLDRPVYSAPSTMNITVYDATRAASNSISVVVTNLTTHSGAVVMLPTTGYYGVFTGAVATVTGTAGAGQLQIANGNQLEVNYWNGGGVKSSASAVADLMPPVISGVTVTADLGVLTITWQTSEPSTSLVHYGANSANLNLTASDNALVTAHVIKIGNLVPGQTYYFSVGSTDVAGNAAINNNGGAYFTFVGLTTPTVLLVDAYDTIVESGNGATVIPDGSYTNVLNAAGVNFAFWKVNQSGSPQLTDLQPYPIVIWRVTDDAVYYGVDADGLPDPSQTNNTLSIQQQYMIQTYLNGGGSFFMASMGILSQIGDTPFRRNVLQVGGFTQNPDMMSGSGYDEDFGVAGIAGQIGTIANGINLALDYSKYPSFDLGGLGDDLGDFGSGPDFSDTFTPTAQSTTICRETNAFRPCAMSYPPMGVDSPGRAVFMSFPFDAVPTSGPSSTNNAVALLKNIIDFLAPGHDGKGMVRLDKTLYTTNTTVTVEVGDSDLIGTGQTTVTFSANNPVGSVTVTLNKTAHPGLFRGTVTLVTGTPGAGQLKVKNGTVVTATYFDASNGNNVTATATVDIVPPVISEVSAAPDYTGALVTWLTSEPADSLVQYGDSPALLNNSVYSSQFVTNRGLTLSPLAANHIYYYQVTSRDPAGNVKTDNNGGSLYTFKTLKAPTPPWITDLESGTSGWTIIADPSYGTSSADWKLGTPNNSLATSAHSGANVWGCSLHGEQASSGITSTYLCAPVLDLSGLKTATLSFWTTFDFTTEIMTGFWLEDGGVLIRTNLSIAPDYTTLPAPVDFASAADPAWTLETVDLTPWVGQTIQIVFYYQGFPILGPTKGWLIDDISVTGTPATGNITITKNLNQGTWTLSQSSLVGATPIQSGNALSTTITNLPVDNYIVQFGDVQYYITPDAQTNTLAPDATLIFAGNYDFVDLNNNGIPDGWEQDYLGAVSPVRTAQTDTDGDGMTDYQEFVAGTNPLNPASRLDFINVKPSSDHRWVNLQWTTVTNRFYQINVSTNLKTWAPVSGWMQGTNGNTMSCGATNTGAMQFFRIQVHP